MKTQSGGRGRVAGISARERDVELETMEESVAQLRVYDGAVYLHAGRSYVVSA